MHIIVMYIPEVRKSASLEIKTKEKTLKAMKTRTAKLKTIYTQSRYSDSFNKGDFNFIDVWPCV